MQGQTQTLNRKKIQNYLNQVPNSTSSLKQSILIMGASKAGKSTFIAAGLKLAKLRGCYQPQSKNQSQKNPQSEQSSQQDSQEKDLDIILQLEDKNQQIEIGTGWNSCTQIPIIHVIEEQNIVDLPGYGDSRGPQNRIVNSFFIDQMLKNSQRIKIVLVAKYDDLRDRSKNSQEILKNIRNRFPNTFPVILQNLILVVTQSNKKVRAIRKRFEELAKNMSIEQKPHVDRDFYAHFSKKENENKIIVMPKAKLNQTYVCAENWKKTVLQQIPYFPTPKFQFYFEQSAQIYIQNFVDEQKQYFFDILEQFQQKIKTQLSQMSQMSQIPQMIKMPQVSQIHQKNQMQKYREQQSLFNHLSQKNWHDQLIWQQDESFFQQSYEKIQSILKRLQWADNIAHFEEKEIEKMTINLYKDEKRETISKFFDSLDKFNKSANIFSAVKLQLSKKLVDFFYFLTSYLKNKMDLVNLIKQKFKNICILYHNYLQKIMQEQQIIYDGVIVQSFNKMHELIKNFSTIQQLEYLNDVFSAWQKDQHENIIKRVSLLLQQNTYQINCNLLKTYERIKKINSKVCGKMQVDFRVKDILFKGSQIQFKINEKLFQKKKQEERKKIQQAKMNLSQQSKKQSSDISLPITDSFNRSSMAVKKSNAFNNSRMQRLQRPQYPPQMIVNVNNSGFNRGYQRDFPLLTAFKNNFQQNFLSHRVFSGVHRLSYHGKYLSCLNGPRMSYESKCKKFQYLQFYPVGRNEYNIKFIDGGFLLVERETKEIRCQYNKNKGYSNWQIQQVQGGIQLLNSRYHKYFNGITSVDDFFNEFTLKKFPKVWILHNN